MRVILLNQSAATGRSQANSLPNVYQGTVRPMSAQVSIDGPGAISATVIIEGTNDGAHFYPVVTFNLSGTDTVTNAEPLDILFDEYVANVTAKSAGAVVTAALGG